MQGIIFDIKRFAVHDGPGIRTTVFLKGCPLRCAWCHNPESQGVAVETRGPQGKEQRVGRLQSTTEILTVIRRDTPFYDESGGGVTFSGGEPLSQPAFLAALLDACGALDIHRAVDTSGHAPLETMLDIARRTDLFLYDLKLADAEAHTRHTGVGVDLIHDNLRRLCEETDVAVEVRIPIIPRVTDARANLAALGALVRSLPRVPPVRLLPYHRASADKYRRFGIPPALPDIEEPTTDALDAIRAELETIGLEVRS